jgi:hypothetical protein
LLLSLFVVLFASEILRIGFGILPGLSAKNAFLYLVVGYLAISAVTEGGVLTARFPPLIGVFLLFVAYTFVSWVVCTIVYSYYPGLFHLINFKNALVDPFLFFAVFFFGCTSRDDAIWLARRICLVVAASSIVLLLDFFNILPLGLVDTVGGRFNGGVGGTSQYAAFLDFFILAMTPMVLSRKRSLIIMVGILASLMLLLQTGSRGALVGLLVGAMGMTFLLRRHIRLPNMMKTGAVVIAGLALIAFAAYLANPEMFIGRVQETRGAGTLDSLSTGRFATWMATVLTMSENPHTFITGVGWDMFLHARIYTDPHNHYLYLLYNVGAIGLALFLVLIAHVIRSVTGVLRTVDETTRAYLVGFLYGLAALLGSIFFAVLYTPWFFIWPYIGLMTKMAWLERNRRAEEAIPAHAGGKALPALRAGQ